MEKALWEKEESQSRHNHYKPISKQLIMAKQPGRYSSRSFYKDVDVEVEIEFEDVREYIEDYADTEELAKIAELIKASNSNEFVAGNDLDGDYVKEEKAVLLARAAKKFTLQELEEKLGGTKFDFI